VPRADVTLHGPQSLPVALVAHPERLALDYSAERSPLSRLTAVSISPQIDSTRAVRSCVELLLARNPQLDPRSVELGRHAMEGAKRMQTLMADLLEYARFGHDSLPGEPVDGEAALAAVLDSLSAAVQRTGAVITHDPLPTVRANPFRFRMLLQNLIDNALKFHADGPLTIHVGVRRESPEFWEFAVRDNGIGFAPDQREKVFNLFQRLHPRSRYAGSGTGLPICRKIVEGYGGRIWAESTPGEGSTFLFTLPGTA